MITFLVEQWDACRAEMAPLWEPHYREIAIHQDAIPLAPNIDEYNVLHAAGQLCVIVGRAAGRIVGYHISIIKPHLHYRNTLHAFGDVYYLAPEYRGNGGGDLMLKAVDEAYLARGVVKAFSAYKIKHPLGKLFAAHGWEETETVVTKLFKRE